ncbi:translation initiation factor IF-2-like [Leopardus geoffroyi]|uniref:translation initiation factor IF-2-like n=1 Tax=Leopardus geoffroyi TaxID=46844 RepID=UPI001E2659A5|nr:translation initiation factor IF-2-like [Leopardus geoffroyi]
MEDASDSTQGVAPLINNVALPGSPPSLPVSVTGCKSHRAANKKVEARSEKLLPTALPPSEPKVDQKLPRSSERRGSGGGTRSPARSQAVAARQAAAGGAAGERRPPGRTEPPLATLVVEKVERWQSACSQVRGSVWSLASRPAPAGKCKRAGEQSGAAPGSARSELLAASGRPAARQARCEPGGGPGAGAGGGGRRRPRTARPRRGVRPHCEPAAGRAEVGRAGRAEAAARLAQYPRSGRSDLGPGGSRGASVTQKAVELPPGARTGPRRRRALPTLPAFLSLQF